MVRGACLGSQAGRRSAVSTVRDESERRRALRRCTGNICVRARVGEERSLASLDILCNIRVARTDLPAFNASMVKKLPEITGTLPTATTVAATLPNTDNDER